MKIIYVVISVMIILNDTLMTGEKNLNINWTTFWSLHICIVGIPLNYQGKIINFFY